MRIDDFDFEAVKNAFRSRSVTPGLDELAHDDNDSHDDHDSNEEL